MRFTRSAGVLLHVTSLPGPCGIGDLGEEAHRFVDWLAKAGQSWWQVLPLGPTSASPYVALSSWAGSPALVSLEELHRAGDLTADELDSARAPDGAAVDFGRVNSARKALLPAAAQRFTSRARGEERERFEAFCAAETWLHDWALFAAAKARHDGRPWWRWPRGLALRKQEALRDFGKAAPEEVLAEKYVQFRFFEQWESLRRKAASAGVRIMGDVPIYCARDSAEVWARRDLFALDRRGEPLVLSGAPPDYFSEEGQLWGTPLYAWDRHRDEGYAWWIERLRAALRHADVVRIDHFRALESYWEVPADAETARTGRWVPGPGDEFMSAVRSALGDAPFIAEDLGMITKPVRELRDRWDLPGMRVVQFAFGEGAASPHHPVRHVRNCVVYTGTHDNDTAAGWYEKAPEHEKDRFRRTTATDGSFCHYHMMRLACSSVADLAVVPMQDVLGLGSWARMNVPGLATSDWAWKLRRGEASAQAAAMMRDLAETFGRLPGQKEAIDE